MIGEVQSNSNLIAFVSLLMFLVPLDLVGRWFFCGGFGFAFLCLGFIGTMHHSPGGMQLRWEIRCAARYLVGALIVLLGITNLDAMSLSLIVSISSTFLSAVEV